MAALVSGDLDGWPGPSRIWGGETMVESTVRFFEGEEVRHEALPGGFKVLGRAARLPGGDLYRLAPCEDRGEMLAREFELMRADRRAGRPSR